MLDVQIGQDLDIGAEQLAIGEHPRRLAVDLALVGDHGPGQHVDPNPPRSGDARGTQRGNRVVAQTVDADGQRGLSPHLVRHHGQRGAGTSASGVGSADITLR